MGWTGYEGIYYFYRNLTEIPLWQYNALAEWWYFYTTALAAAFGFTLELWPTGIVDVDLFQEVGSWDIAQPPVPQQNTVLIPRDTPPEYPGAYLWAATANNSVVFNRTRVGALVQRMYEPLVSAFWSPDVPWFEEGVGIGRVDWPGDCGPPFGPGSCDYAPDAIAKAWRRATPNKAARLFIERFQLGTDNVRALARFWYELVYLHGYEPPIAADIAACEWILANREVWGRFIPVITVDTINVGLLVLFILVPLLVILLVMSCSLVFSALCAHNFYGKRNNVAPRDGEVGIVFTDIQNSTALWAANTRVMRQAVLEHHRVLRRLVGFHGGYEVKTIGDAFMVVFSDPISAVNFAVDAQVALVRAPNWPLRLQSQPDAAVVKMPDALAAKVAAVPQGVAGRRNRALRTLAHNIVGGEPSAMTCSDQPPLVTEPPRRAAWKRHLLGGACPEDAVEELRQRELRSEHLWSGLRVRIGLHWGLPDIDRDPVSKGYDYYGSPVNVAARTEAAGHGGQVLASHSMVEAIIAALTSDAIRARGTVWTTNQDAKGAAKAVVAQVVVPFDADQGKVDPVPVLDWLRASTKDVVADGEGADASAGMQYVPRWGMGRAAQTPQGVREAAIAGSGLPIEGWPPERTRPTPPTDATSFEIPTNMRAPGPPPPPLVPPGDKGLIRFQKLVDEFSHTWFEPNRGTKGTVGWFRGRWRLSLRSYLDRVGLPTLPMRVPHFRLRSGTTFQHVGGFDLKGYDRAVHLYNVGIVALPRAFDAPRATPYTTPVPAPTVATDAVAAGAAEKESTSIGRLPFSAPYITPMPTMPLFVHTPGYPITL